MVLVLGGALPTELGGQPAASCAAPPFHAFDFMIGRWHGEELAVAEGDTTVASTSEVEVLPILGNCALEETWSVSAEGAPLFDARIIRAYDAVSERWMLSYADTGGRFQVYEGQMGEDGWSFYRERSTDAGPVLVRIRWTAAADGFVQVIDRSSDGGRSWEPGSVVRYRPAGKTPDR